MPLLKPNWPKPLAVTVQLTLIPASLVAYAAPELVRQLKNLFEEKMVELGAEVVTMNVEESGDGFTILATVMAFAGEISQAEMAAVQAELSEAVLAAVTIDTNILFGTQLKVETPVLATPTVEP